MNKIKMKKLLIILLSITVLIFTYILIKPNISRTCWLSDFGISLKIPYAYSKVEENNDNKLINLYNDKNGITINGTDLGANFWSSKNLEDRVEEYTKVIAAMNYDASVKNIKKEILNLEDGRVGRVEIEIEKPNKSLKTISLITENSNGNLIVEFYGEKNNIEVSKADIETIISSIKIEKNKHIYTEDLINIGQENALENQEDINISGNSGEQDTEKDSL